MGWGEGKWGGEEGGGGWGGEGSGRGGGEKYNQVPQPDQTQIDSFATYLLMRHNVMNISQWGGGGGGQCNSKTLRQTFATTLNEK